MEPYKCTTTKQPQRCFRSTRRKQRSMWTCTIISRQHFRGLTFRRRQQLCGDTQYLQKHGVLLQRSWINVELITSKIGDRAYEKGRIVKIAGSIEKQSRR